MKLDQELANVFREELAKVIKNEIDDPNYLPQEAFANCMDRAKTMLEEFMPTVEKVLAGAIATHRIEHHDEKREEELKMYQKGLEPSYMQITLQGWWGG